MKLDNKKLIIITVAAITVIAVISLFVLRVGVADNGNLRYVLEDIGIYDHQGASGSGCYANGFGVASKTLGTGTGGLVYGLVKLLVPVDSVVGVFVPALIYLMMFIGGIFLFVKNMQSDKLANNIMMCVLILVVIADAGYLAFFNTPYTEGAFIAYLTLFAGLYTASAKTGKILYLVLTGIAGALFGATGIFASVVGVFLSLAMLGFVKQSNMIKKIIAIVSACLIFVSSLYGFTVDKSGDNMRYNRIFYGILSVAENDEQALADLGIDVKFAEYADVDCYNEKAIKFIASSEFAEIKDKASIFAVFKYYVTHPNELMSAVEKSVNNSTRIKSDYLGDYPVGSSKAGQHNSFWSIYSNIKHRIIPASLPILAIFAVAVVFFALSYKRKHNNNQEIATFAYLVTSLAVGMILMIPLGAVVNGFSMIDFYMRSYNFVFDIVLCCAVAGGIRILLARQQALRDKYGVNQ